MWEWLREIVNRLMKYRLTTHAGSHPRPVTEGIPFLGFTVFPQRRRLKRRKGIYFQRKMKHLKSAFREGDIPLEKVSESVRGWVNHARYGNTVGLRKAILCKPF